MSPTVMPMSVSTVVTASGTVTSNVAVLFGLTVAASVAAADPAPTDVGTVSVYDGTSTSGTKVAEIVFAVAAGASPPPGAETSPWTTREVRTCVKSSST